MTCRAQVLAEFQAKNCYPDEDVPRLGGFWEFETLFNLILTRMSVGSIEQIQNAAFARLAW